MLTCKFKLLVMNLSIMKMSTSGVYIDLINVPIPIEIPHAYFPAFQRVGK